MSKEPHHDCGHDHEHGHGCGHDHAHDHVHSHDHGKPSSVFRIAGSAIIILWGVLMIAFYGADRIGIYLKGSFQVQALIGGLGLIVLGLFNLLNRREVGCGHDHDHDHDDDGHGHVHHHHHEEDTVLGRLTLMLILVVPVTVAAIWTPDAFSANAVRNKGIYDPDYSARALDERFDLRSKMAVTTGEKGEPGQPGADPKAAASETNSYGEFTLEDLKAQVPMSDDGNFIIDLVSLYYTASDEEVQKVLDGQPVETVAQVMPEQVNNPNGTRVRIFKLYVQCCRADARPLSIPVEFGKAPPEFREMGWVKVVGNMAYATENGMTVPILMAKSMEAAEAPETGMY